MQKDDETHTDKIKKNRKLFSIHYIFERYPFGFIFLRCFFGGNLIGNFDVLHNFQIKL